MSKPAWIAIPAAATALAVAAAAFLWQGQKTDAEGAADTGITEGLSHNKESLARIEQVAVDLQAQAKTTARLLSDLNSRLNQIERSNKQALNKLSTEIDQVSSRQDMMEAPVSMGGEADGSTQDPASVLKELRRQFEESTTSKSADKPATNTEKALVSKFYQHGELDEASRQREALISQSLASDIESTEVLGVECRNAVCKVEFRPELPMEAGGEMSELELINAITVGMGKPLNIVGETFEDGTSAIFIEESQDL